MLCSLYNLQGLDPERESTGPLAGFQVLWGSVASSQRVGSWRPGVLCTLGSLAPTLLLLYLCILQGIAGGLWGPRGLRG